MAATAISSNTHPQTLWASSRRCWTGTPEIFLPKNIDNTRLVRVADPRRSREMRMLMSALCVLFALVMIYAWQHFSAIEYGYRIEALKTQRETLLESNRALKLEEASLRDPERIDTLARQLGLQSPQAGQVLRMDAEPGAADTPVMARANSIAVISALQ